ncbi:MAG TPA: hypothetical protein DD671_17250, partial [Balneolaceae bacterium]|nr:hypothetical protein [Balneolaceae bacterium]
ANKNFKHGGYSQYAHESLKDVLTELEGVDGEDLIDPRHEIKLLQALIISAKALENRLSDLEDLERISNVVSKLIIAKQRSQKILEESRRLVPADDLKIFLA